jgi:hypothetical protein
VNKLGRFNACVLMLAVVVGVFAVIQESHVIDRLHATTRSGRRVTCTVWEGESALKVSVQERTGGCTEGAHELRLLDSTAAPEDIAVEYDSVAEEFIIAVGKEQIRMKADLGLGDSGGSDGS